MEELTGNKEDIGLLRGGCPISELQSRETHKVNPVETNKVIMLTSCKRIMTLVLAEGLEKQITMPQLGLIRVHTRKPIVAGGVGSGKSIYVSTHTAAPCDGKFPRLLPVFVGHTLSFAGKKSVHICDVVSVRK